MKKLRVWIRRFFFPRHSILAVLMFVIMLTVVTALVFTGVILTFNERSAFRNLTIHSISTLAGVIGTNSTAALAFADSKVGNEILAGLVSEPEIVLGCLYDKQQQLFAMYEVKDQSDQCPEFAPSEGSDFSLRHLSFTKSIWHDSENYGTIFLQSNMQSYYTQLRTSILLMMAVLLGAVAIAYFIARSLQKLVTGSIFKLTETTRQITEEGRYDLRAERSSEVEINVLVNSFNQMLDVIQERDEFIRQSEEQFRAAFELAAVGNVLISPHGDFLRVNSEICRLLGYTKKELLQFNFADVTYPADLDLSQSYQSDLVQGESPSSIFEKRYVTKNGTILWAILSAAPIRDSAGNVTALIAVVQDITERKRAEQERDRLLLKEREARLEAEKSIQVRDEFLSIASHELRTPLTPIKMHLEMMRMQLQEIDPASVPGSLELIKAFDISERQVANLENLIQDLLDVSRITAGRVVLNRRTVHLQDLILDILERSQLEIQKSSSRIDLKFDAQPIGDWDPMRIEQIFLNLLTNAFKYGNGQPIEIAVSESATHAILAVRDHGIGISPENHSRIFERFERVASIRHYSGLGLGLYITRELVLAHGGSIRVQSELGKGSTFIVELPLALNYLQ